ncbi:class A sortase [Leuconostoc mesenteroides]
MMIKLPSVLAAASDNMTLWEITQKIGIYVAIFVIIFLLVAASQLVISRLRHKQFSHHHLFYDALFTASFISLLVLGGSYLYQKNVAGIKTAILKPIHKQERKTANKKAAEDITSRTLIRKMVMRNATKNFEKQGFVSIPSANILLPIYNDAYSAEGLNLGANYANKSEKDPEGQQKPVMGQGNYGLAAHNFNDGQTGFSALQQTTNNDSPYLQNGKLKGSSWLNGKSILLANGEGIYRYEITSQNTVLSTEVSVLNPTKEARLTIISCLFPSTTYRIITHAELKKTYTWDSAPEKLVSEFNLKVRNTNARVSWWNPGVEEGANGDAGGTK